MKTLLTLFLIMTSLNLFSQNQVSILPKIEFEQETITVKPIDIDTLSIRFKTTNIGGQNLELINVKPSCGCTVVDFPKSIAPGETVWIMVKIANPHPPFTKSVTVDSNDPERPSVVLIVKSEIN